MDQIIVSILMPVYNEADYLEECLESILKQDLITWELIVVDDFSTDSSWEILQYYAHKDHRIRPLKNTSKGIIPALKKAFKNCVGTYVTRMDADDIMSPDKLSSMVEVLTINVEHTIAVGLVSYFSNDGISDGYRKYERWLNELIRGSNNFIDIYKECVIPSPCWMTSKYNLQRCGGFDSNRYPEDYDLAFRFYMHQCTVRGIPKVLHKWRDYPTRSSRVDPHYSDNRFLDLKLYYFLRKDWNKKPLVIWGAGKKGKYIARNLLDQKVNFTWICNNPSKIGRDIYGVVLEDSEAYIKSPNSQFIIAIASKNTSSIIQENLDVHAYIRNLDYFWFC